MKRLSEHFISSEFECSCCGNVEVDPVLIEGLETLRKLIRVPIQVNSGYRCVSHNEAIGGAVNSQHLTGKAADVHIPTMSPKEVAERAETIKVFRNGGIGIYTDWEFTHLDVRGKRARWGE